MLPNTEHDTEQASERSGPVPDSPDETPDPKYTSEAANPDVALQHEADSSSPLFHHSRSSNISSELRAKAAMAGSDDEGEEEEPLPQVVKSEEEEEELPNKTNPNDAGNDQESSMAPSDSIEGERQSSTLSNPSPQPQIISSSPPSTSASSFKPKRIPLPISTPTASIPTHENPWPPPRLIKTPPPPPRIPLPMIKTRPKPASFPSAGQSTGSLQPNRRPEYFPSQDIPTQVANRMHEKYGLTPQTVNKELEIGSEVQVGGKKGSRRGVAWRWIVIIVLLLLLSAMGLLCRIMTWGPFLPFFTRRTGPSQDKNISNNTNKGNLSSYLLTPDRPDIDALVEYYSGDQTSSPPPIDCAPITPDLITASSTTAFRWRLQQMSEDGDERIDVPQMMRRLYALERATRFDRTCEEKGVVLLESVTEI